MDTATGSKLSLRIAYNGVEKTLEGVNEHQQVQAVLEHALRLFNVTDRPHAQGLFREDGSEVSTGQSVEAAGLEEGTLLFLRPRIPQGG
jgi:hypothetical protein